MLTAIAQKDIDARCSLPVRSVGRKANAVDIEVDLSAPEPPSKKAKRALKKGKKLGSSGAGKKSKRNGHDDDDDLTKDDAGEGATDKGGKPARSEHGVWIGNLPFLLTAAQLRDWLVSNSGGAITSESITRMKLPTLKDPGRDKSAKPSNRGFAYVDVADMATKVAAIALSETELAGRKLLIKDSTSFEGRPKKKEPAALVVGPDGEVADGKSKPLQDQKQAFSKDAEAGRKIFVGNMSFQTTEEDVRRNFDKCGEIESVKVATFEDSGKCKGFGWVKFKDADAAAWAVKGFVKIKEAIETEEDFADGKDDDGDDGNGNGRGNEQQQRQYKTRKWWVNRILGRTLKIELAEDDHVRYKKRFGKDAQQPDKGGKGPGGKPRGGEGPGRPAGGELKGSSDIQVARLTGAVVKSTGTKVTFD
ncbi:RNA recognition motif (RRM) domain [Geosmithia morbida]|uniref:RNA recognition motif (RRM) domain n=1 Tax=Geosmithia morbida TaxID=1094350 RepID=A0A9P4Z1K0_9HYPO|nr:RNA recognition motif (RRM) domain [Geosmithia morbida]KAF4125722.1 RNA recognition motif (RRM) domain [Geosmithia morbida]